MSLALGLWRGLTRAAAPLLRANLRRRLARGKEDAARLPERFGEGAARPPGPLLWLHAASVGESQSMLPVLRPLLDARPDLAVLITTGTVTSATLLAQRLPPDFAARVIHRYVPLDVPAWVERFMQGWRPDAAAFVDSELWPNLIMAVHARGIPLALVNARMSPRSARFWGLFPGIARQVLAPFHLVLAKSEEDAQRFRALGASDVRHWGNLKTAAAPLPADPAELARLSALMEERPVVLGAVTHPGEEAMLLEAHRGLQRHFPRLLTILAPRHPHRGGEIAALAGGMRSARRSLREDPLPGVSVWIMDTIGELGLAYRLAQVAFIGGSLVPHGGQNPLEAARLRCPVLLGPHTGNFPEIVPALLAAGGALLVPDAAALAPALSIVLSEPRTAAAMRDAAATLAADAAGLPHRVAQALAALLPGS